MTLVPVSMMALNWPTEPTAEPPTLALAARSQYDCETTG